MYWRCSESPQTVITVAYGDIYPTTALGRVVATVVMTTGIGFVAFLTGAVAQRFLHGSNGGTTQEATPCEDEVSRTLTELAQQVAELRRALERGRMTAVGTLRLVPRS